MFPARGFCGCYLVCLCLGVLRVLPFNWWLFVRFEFGLVIWGLLCFGFRFIGVT